jgi:hypothetical protein
VHELRLSIDCEAEMVDVEPQLAALGLVRQLPALTRLELVVYGTQEDPEPQWPAFIPSKLKALHINLKHCNGPLVSEALLRALPGMLGASGARLDRLEMLIPSDFDDVGDGLVHLAQALRCCSPTLKRFLLSGIDRSLGEDAEDYSSEKERLRVQWADVLAGVSACRELQVLVLPDILLEPLFPSDTAFARLTHLQISDMPREDPCDAGEMGLWELMTSGGLPALAKLKVVLPSHRMRAVEWLATLHSALPQGAPHLVRGVGSPGDRAPAARPPRHARGQRGRAQMPRGPHALRLR